ncbi:MAG: homoserine kinase [Methylotenera sp.]
MSVFTTLNLEEVRVWLRDFTIGEIVELRGIAAGITNTNYFVITDSTRYVLTIFEHNKLEELPYFVDLMTHLAKHGVPCPAPIIDKNGLALHVLKGKPALMVSCLNGRDIETPNAAQCAQVASGLAQLHIAGQSFVKKSHNQRDQDWRDATVEQVMLKLSADEQKLLKTELYFQDKLDLSQLPHGVVHGDLFRDNVLFNGDKLGGFIDFYYACDDSFAYDVAIAVNDWCVLADGSFDDNKLNAFLNAYQAVRPFTAAENASWHALLRGAALRFWLSRLFDFYYPAEGELTHAKDPNHFKKILQHRILMEK